MARRTLEQVDEEARIEFAHLLEVVQRPLWDQEQAAVEQDKLNLERYAVWKRLNPGKRVPRTPGDVALQLGEYDEGIKQPYVDRANAEYERRKAERDAAEERMCELAPDIVLTGDHVAGPNYVADAVHAHSYPNQTADEHYSEVSAKLRCAGYAKHVPAHVQREDDYFRIYVCVGDLFEVEVVKRLPGLTLCEWLKLCMQLGANPRVYNPFLPHGLEAKLGLDYFGNDVVKL